VAERRHQKVNYLMHFTHGFSALTTFAAVLPDWFWC
jgi:hypothetical protein